MNYHALPKIDLHCHLDGSVRPETILELAQFESLDVPQTVEDLKTQLIAPESCASLDEYLKRFSIPVQLMQTADHLERITYELFEDAARENVKHLEVRFGPLLHLERGLSIDEVFESVIKGMKRATKDYDISGNIIASVLRTMKTDRVMDLINSASQYDEVVAIDLASSEVAGFCINFEPFIAYAREKGLHVTIHAGETGVGQNVFDAITLLQAERIGHGIYIKDHKAAYELVRTGVGLEICPTSNVQTKAVDSMESHPIDAFYKDGLPVTINTDNRTVSNTTMTEEIKRTIETFNLSLEDYWHIYKTSVEQSFADDTVKNRLLNYLKQS